MNDKLMESLVSKLQEDNLQDYGKTTDYNYFYNKQAIIDEILQGDEALRDAANNGVPGEEYDDVVEYVKGELTDGIKSIESDERVQMLSQYLGSDFPGIHSGRVKVTLEDGRVYEGVIEEEYVDVPLISICELVAPDMQLVEGTEKKEELLDVNVNKIDGVDNGSNIDIDLDESKKEEFLDFNVNKIKDVSDSKIDIDESKETKQEGLFNANISTGDIGSNNNVDLGGLGDLGDMLGEGVDIEKDLYVYTDANANDLDTARANIDMYKKEAPTLKFRVYKNDADKDEIFYIDMIGSKKDIQDFIVNNLGWYSDEEIDKLNVIRPYKSVKQEGIVDLNVDTGDILSGNNIDLGGAGALLGMLGASEETKESDNKLEETKLTEERLNFKKYGIERTPELDFSDDGNRFRMYQCNGIPISYLKDDGYVFLAIRLNYLEGLTYNEYSKLPSYKDCDKYNYVAEDKVDLADVAKICKKVKAEYDEALKDIKNVSDEEFKAYTNKYLEKAKKEFEEAKKIIKDIDTVDLMNASEWDIKDLKRYLQRTKEAIDDWSWDKKSRYNQELRRDRLQNDTDESYNQVSWYLREIKEIAERIKNSKTESLNENKEDDIDFIMKLVNESKKVSKSCLKEDLTERQQKVLALLKTTIQNLHYLDNLLYDMETYEALQAIDNNTEDKKRWAKLREVVIQMSTDLDNVTDEAYKDLIKTESKTTDLDKVTKLKLMDKAARSINDEEIIELWLMAGVPDGATEEDFEDIAKDDKVFNEIEEEFKKVMKLALEDGLYDCDKKAYEFAKQYEPQLVNESKSCKTEAKFKDKVKAIKKSLKDKDGRLSDKTAEEQAKKIAGSMIKNEASEEIKEYRYITNHGIGPGTLPEGVFVRAEVLPNYRTAIYTNRPLTEEELRKYDIKPEWIQETKQMKTEGIVKEGDLIPTGLSDAKAEDVLNSVIGQMSDGMWENVPQMDRFWQYADIVNQDGQIYIKVDRDKFSSGYRDKTDEEVKKYFANKVKQIAKEYIKDYVDTKPDLKWDRNCTENCSYLDYHSGATIQDAYRVYDKLMGRIDRIKTEGKEDKKSAKQALLDLNVSDFQELRDALDKMLENDIINEEYEDFLDIILNKEEACEDYIRRRSDVTNTDWKDEMGIESDYVTAAIQEIIGSLEESKSIKVELNKLDDKLQMEIYELIQNGRRLDKQDMETNIQETIKAIKSDYPNVDAEEYIIKKAQEIYDGQYDDIKNESEKIEIKDLEADLNNPNIKGDERVDIQNDIKYIKDTAQRENRPLTEAYTEGYKEGMRAGSAFAQRIKTVHKNALLKKLNDTLMLEPSDTYSDDYRDGFNDAIYELAAKIKNATSMYENKK